MRNDAVKSRLEALHTLSLFSHCSERQLEYVDSRTDQVSIPAGEVLIQEGRLNHTFFLLMDGAVQITRGGEPVAVRGPGDYFGEISMVDRGEATATVTAATDSTFLVMSHEQFRDAVMANDDILAPVLRTIQLRKPDAE
jgi:CRP/FNR family transcriptional regulator, cyclic AMP receptor protein